MYVLNSRNDVVIKQEDNKPDMYIPNDPDNRDWQDYQAWLANGNIPEMINIPN